MMIFKSNIVEHFSKVKHFLIIFDTFKNIFYLLNAKYSLFKENRALKLGIKYFSQEGEDNLLVLLLTIINGHKNLDKGFYVDIGAFHPFKFSNTNYFYQNGW